MKGRGSMAVVQEVRITTTDGKIAAVRVEYNDGGTDLIVAEPLPSRLDPAALKIQVANQLKAFGTDADPDQMIIECWPAT
jgi:hypothetical protein